MKIFFKIALLILLLVVLVSTCCVSAFASDEISVPEDIWNGFEESIPEEAEGFFQSGAFDNETSYSSAIEDITEPKAIITVLFELLGVEATLSCNLLALLMGALLVSAVLSTVGEQSNNKTLVAIMKLFSPE